MASSQKSLNYRPLLIKKIVEDQKNSLNFYSFNHIPRSFQGAVSLFVGGVRPSHNNYWKSPILFKTDVNVNIMETK